MADELEPPGNDLERHDASSHLPSPTIWPFLFAVGVALVLLALILGTWLVFAIGAALALVFGFLWIRDATRGVRAAPEPEPVGARAADLEAEEEEGPPRYPRSVFLEGATLGIGAAIGGIVTLPAVGFMILPAFVDQEYPEVDLGPLDNYPEGEWMIVKFVSDPEEPPDVARRTAYVRYNGTNGGAPSFTILSNRCVHLGCPVRPQGLTEEQSKDVETESGIVELASTSPSGWVCPCHGGSYSLEGNRQSGPPVRALDRYKFLVRDDRLVLGEPYSVAEVEGEGAEATIKAYDLVDPGQHIDGPEQYFYPYVP